MSSGIKQTGHDAAVDMGSPSEQGDGASSNVPRRRKQKRISHDQIPEREHAERRKQPQPSGELVDHPSEKTVRVRQGTGPRATVTVLFVSMLAAAVAGALLLAYFMFSR